MPKGQGLESGRRLREEQGKSRGRSAQQAEWTEPAHRSSLNLHRRSWEAAPGAQEAWPLLGAGVRPGPSSAATHPEGTWG